MNVARNIGKLTVNDMTAMIVAHLKQLRRRETACVAHEMG
jgi:hypothetical protein